jgi:hypothetical protein
VERFCSMVIDIACAQRIRVDGVGMMDGALLR